MDEASAAGALGRPREFCTDAALRVALSVFWRKGYEGACGSSAEAARGEVARRRKNLEEALTRRFARARAVHDLPPQVDPVGLTHYLLAVVQGMAVQAGSGVPREELDRLVETTLRVWPSP